MRLQSEELLAQLQSSGVLYGLGTVETEELTQLVSTVMASPSQSSIQRMKALLNGLKASPTTMSERRPMQALIQAILQSQSNVRYAAVTERAGRVKGISVYFNRR